MAGEQGDIYHADTPAQQVAPYIARLQEAVFDLVRQIGVLGERLGSVESSVKQAGGDLTLLSDSVLQLNRQVVLAIEGMATSLTRDLQIHGQLSMLIEAIRSTDEELRKQREELKSQREHIDQMMAEIFKHSVIG